MRSLTLEEVEIVGGGDFFGTIQDFTTFGGTVGTVLGYAVTGTVAGATEYGLYGGALGFAAGLGWGVGTVLYDWACG